MTQPDVWLRGPVAGVPALLQPATHALLQAAQDVDRVVAELLPDDLWRRPGGAASAGFHLKHLVGATERLLCIFHAAEHASRHAGQLTTTVKALE